MHTVWDQNIIFLLAPNSRWQAVTMSPATMWEALKASHAHWALADLSKNSLETLDSAMLTIEKQNSIMSTLQGWIEARSRRGLEA